LLRPDGYLDLSELPSTVTVKALRNVRTAIERQSQEAEASTDPQAAATGLLQCTELGKFAQKLFAGLNEVRRLSLANQVAMTRLALQTSELEKQCVKKALTAITNQHSSSGNSNESGRQAQPAEAVDKRLVSSPAIDFRLALAHRIGERARDDVLTRLNACEEALLKMVTLAPKGGTPHLEVHVSEVTASDRFKSDYRKSKKSDILKVPIQRVNFEYLVAVFNSAEARRQLWEIYAKDMDDEKIADAMLRVLRVRQEMAHAMGYKCWGDMQIHKRMVETRGSIRQLHRDVQTALHAPLQSVIKNVLRSISLQERQSGKAPARKRQPGGGGGSESKIDYVDFQHFAMNEVGYQQGFDLMDYFSQQYSVPKILEMLSELHGFHIELVPTDVSNLGWPPNYQIHAVYDRQEHQVAPDTARPIVFLYLACTQHATLLDFVRVPIPVNIPPHAQKLAEGHIKVYVPNMPHNPGLALPLNLSLVSTICHELGHAVHYIHQMRHQRRLRHAQPLTAGEARWRQAEASDAFWDVELPTDIQETAAVYHEHLFRDPSVLANISKHIKDGTPLPSYLAKVCPFDVLYHLQYLQWSEIDDHIHGPDLDPNKCTAAELVSTMGSIFTKMLPVNLPNNWTAPLLKNWMIFAFTSMGYAGITSVYLCAHVRASCAVAAYRRARQNKAALAAYSEKLQGFLQHPVYPDAAFRLHSTLDPSQGPLDPTLPGIYGKARNTQQPQNGDKSGQQLRGLFAWKAHPAEHLLG